jgi:predicted HAD superfamily Cof-like phosphohydrolase
LAHVLDNAFRMVHASNMSKLMPDGTVLRREDGKVLKGPNYQPPNIEALI